MPLSSDYSPVIYRYHSTNRPCLYFNDSFGKHSFSCGDNLFLGIELEFDTRDVTVGLRSNKYELISKSNTIWDSDTFIYYMNDGSLYRGLEMITQPATYEYHLANRDKYAELFKEISNHGFKSQSFRSCGLHIHFNRDFYQDNPDYYTINLLYLVEKFWRELVLMSRRFYPNLVRWANKYDKKPEEVVGDMKACQPHQARYRVINLVNSSTIEFRIYRGTLDIDDFFATLELTKNLIECAKNHSPIELQGIEFTDIVNTSPELLKYYKKCHRKSAIDKLPPELR